MYGKAYQFIRNKQRRRSRRTINAAQPHRFVGKAGGGGPRRAARQSAGGGRSAPPDAGGGLVPPAAEAEHDERQRAGAAARGGQGAARWRPISAGNANAAGGEGSPTAPQANGKGGDASTTLAVCLGRSVWGYDARTALGGRRGSRAEQRKTGRAFADEAQPRHTRLLDGRDNTHIGA